MMTAQELYKEVAQLGFEDSLGDDGTSRFIYAVNRALIEVNSLRPTHKRTVINHRVPNNLLFSEPTVIEKSDTLTFSAMAAKSFYFEVQGEGRYTVGLKHVVKSVDEEGKTTLTETLYKDNGEGEEVTFGEDNTKKFVTVKGFIKYNGAFIDKLMENNTEDSYYTGEAVIIFEGEYDYTIRNLAMYDKVYSSSINDIVPYGKSVGYTVSELVDDFEKFATPPIAPNGQHLYKDYYVENDTIYLPENNAGVYEINYLHKVALIPLDTDISAASTSETPIDLADDLAALLPNLIAAYVWLDDETEKSQYYLNLYLQRAEQIKREARSLNPVVFESVNGW